jgi:HSP20 family protein
MRQERQLRKPGYVQARRRCTVVATNLAVPKEVGEVTSPEIIKGGVYYTPRVDVYETPEELVVLCDLPGVKPENLELKFEKGELSLHGTVPPRQESVEFLTGEYGVGDFFRSFTIPAEVNVDLITAECKMGVLTVHLPKIEAVKPKRIPIKPE